MLNPFCFNCTSILSSVSPTSLGLFLSPYPFALAPPIRGSIFMRSRRVLLSEVFPSCPISPRPTPKAEPLHTFPFSAAPDRPPGEACSLPFLSTTYPDGRGPQCAVSFHPTLRFYQHFATVKESGRKRNQKPFHLRVFLTF